MLGSLFVEIVFLCVVCLDKLWSPVISTPIAYLYRLHVGRLWLHLKLMVVSSNLVQSLLDESVDVTVSG